MQVGFPPGEDFLDSIQRIHDKYSGPNSALNLTDELMTHLEFANLSGRVGAFGLPLVRFTTEQRLQEIIADLEDNGIAVFNPHTYVLEDGGMKQTDEDQLAFKRKVDAAGLLNPGKMRAFEEGRANFDGTAGFDRIRVGSLATQKSSSAVDIMGDAMFEQNLESIPELSEDMLAVLRHGENDDDDDDVDDLMNADEEEDEEPKIVPATTPANRASTDFADRGCRFPQHVNNWSDRTTVDFAARAQSVRQDI